jgi:hypothetical protein
MQSLPLPFAIQLVCRLLTRPGPQIFGFAEVTFHFANVTNPVFQGPADPRTPGCIRREWAKMLRSAEALLAWPVVFAPPTPKQERMAIALLPTPFS